MPKKKTWSEKLKEAKVPQIKQLDKAFADMPEGSMMLIATPQIIDEYVRGIAFGKRVDTKTMRRDLAQQFEAEYTCPVTTGIFLRIVAEASFENLHQGASLGEITPFWRVIEPGSPLAKKLSFGPEFIMEQIQAETA